MVKPVSETIESNLKNILCSGVHLSRLAIDYVFFFSLSRILEVLRVRSLVTRERKIKMINISFSRVGIEPTTYCVYSHTLVPLLHD